MGTQDNDMAYLALQSEGVEQHMGEEDILMEAFQGEVKVSSKEKIRKEDFMKDLDAEDYKAYSDSHEYQ